MTTLQVKLTMPNQVANEAKRAGLWIFLIRVVRAPYFVIS